MSSGDMYAEPSYDDVQKEVGQTTQGQNVARPSSGSGDMGCIWIVLGAVVIFIIYLLLTR